MNYNSHLGTLGIQSAAEEEELRLAESFRAARVDAERKAAATPLVYSPEMAQAIMPGAPHTTTRPWVILTLIAVPVIGVLIYKWKK